MAINGQSLPPYVPPPVPPKAPTKTEIEAEQKKNLPPEDPKLAYQRNALFTTAGTTTALGLAALVPNAPMMTTFALSCWVGNSCVQGVSHALHSNN